MAAAIEATGVVRRFGAVTALDGVDLEVAPGTMFGLIGPNGAGKTTLLQILAAVRDPTRHAGREPPAGLAAQLLYAVSSARDLGRRGARGEHAATCPVPRAPEPAHLLQGNRTRDLSQGRGTPGVVAEGRGDGRARVRRARARPLAPRATASLSVSSFLSPTTWWSVTSARSSTTSGTTATAIAIIGRTRRINIGLADSAEPIALHVCVDSGVPSAGATQTEGRPAAAGPIRLRGRSPTSPRGWPRWGTPTR